MIVNVCNGLDLGVTEANRESSHIGLEINVLEVLVLHYGPKYFNTDNAIGHLGHKQTFLAGNRAKSLL